MPLLGRFDLVTCFGDVPNHLGSLEEVRTALTGLRRNLRHGGMLLFDVNLLAAYRDVPDVTVRDDDRIVTWWGSRAQIREPGGSGEVVIDVFQRGEDRLWHRSTCRQPHRHHPLPGVLDAVSAAGLEILEVRGHVPGAGLQPQADESLHPKAVVLARRPAPSRKTRRAHDLAHLTRRVPHDRGADRPTGRAPTPAGGETARRYCHGPRTRGAQLRRDQPVEVARWEAAASVSRAARRSWPSEETSTPCHRPRDRLRESRPR